LDNLTTADAVWDLIKNNSEIKNYLTDDWLSQTQSVFDKLNNFKENLDEYIVE
jgi:hypothetical protein